MGDLNWAGGAAGFGKGLMSGYQTVMEMKMKEDFMMRLDEAKSARDLHYAKLREVEIDAPIRKEKAEREDARYAVQDDQWNKKFGLDQQELGLRRQSLSENSSTQ